eukprot:scaffold8599_cov41-Phaeocystis_antarctica.AAC.1
MTAGRHLPQRRCRCTGSLPARLGRAVPALTLASALALALALALAAPNPSPDPIALAPALLPHQARWAYLSTWWTSPTLGRTRPRCCWCASPPA